MDRRGWAAFVLAGLAGLVLLAARAGPWAEAAPAAPPSDVGADGVRVEPMPRGLKDPPRPCRPEEAPPSVTRTPGGAALNIPARDQAPERPPEGWCGETAIQEAMLFGGAWLPQKHINAAGRPVHPDLYANEIPAALAGVGAAHEVCRKESRDLPAFLRWIRAEIDLGRPVLVGVKVNPTRHENWGLDHFVTAVAYDGDVFIFNTTGASRESRTVRQLSSTQDGYGLKNRLNAYYGISIRGQAGLGPDFAAVRLRVEKESRDRADLLVACEGLEPGRRYVVYRLSSADQKRAAPLAVFEASGGVYALRDTVRADGPALYRCRPTRAPAPAAEAP